MKDDGLYRGDGAFEVIRLYEGRPFALGDHLDRLERSAAAIELEFDRAALEREIEALLAEAGEADGQLRLIVTRGGRRIAATEPIPPTARRCGSPPSPTPRRVILNGVKSLSYAANMQATRLAKGAGRRRGGAGAARRHRAGAADLGDLLGLAAGRRCARRRSTAACSSRSPATAWSRRCDVEEGAWPVADLRAAQEAFLASTTREIQAGRRDRRRRAARRARPAHPRGAGGIRGDARARASRRRPREGVRWTSS